MNIFYIDHDPVKAAQWLVDKHCVKMITESVQLLSTAHRVTDGEKIIGKKNGRKYTSWKLHDSRENVLYKATHINHPSNSWVRTSVENYLWLVEHTYAIIEEYNRRYGKVHKCSGMMYALQSPPYNLKEWERTDIPMVMPPEYVISDDPVENYRNFYRYGKAHIHSWKNKEKPEWL